MSRQLISLNSDLRRLRDEGYELELRDGYLLVHAVPYVTSARQVALGTLVSELTLSAPDTLAAPGTHQIYFMGTHPCHADGRQLIQISHSSQDQQLANGLTVNHYFSHRPKDRYYTDYYEKIRTYVRVISDPARVIDPAADARTFKTVEPVDEDSVLVYDDTSSSRAGIRALAQRLSAQRVAIVGLGGTGAYVLDFLAKTHVREIHLYDADAFHQHNAFRTPGAATREHLDLRLSKVAYLHRVYSAMHRGIHPHAAMISENNVSELGDFDYVFLCVDKGSVRQLIADCLDVTDATFLDTGMGVNLSDDGQQLWGSCRLTTSVPGHRPAARSRLPAVDRQDELYGSNIQIAELNCMNALFAILKWKRLSGFYIDDRQDFNTTFNVALNQMSNEEEGA